MQAALIVLALLLSLSQQEGVQSRELHYDWKMIITSCPKSYQSLTQKEFRVTVPSTLHLNLEKQNQIPNPFFGENLKALAPLSECSVKFKTNIVIKTQLNDFQKVALVFEGIDTYSEIYLNEKFLGKTSNAFIKYEYEVQKLLKKGNNQLLVQIKPTKSYDKEGQQKDRMPFEYAHTRKPGYQYSWDWAPFMNTLGIWLPVRLYFYQEVKLDYVWIRAEEIKQSRAILDFVVALEGISADERLNGYSVQIARYDQDEAEQEYTLPGKYTSVKYKIDNPKLWWPNGIGEPYVYEFQVTILKEGKFVDKKRIVYGIRTVELNQENVNFRISVNGHPIYCKGANYVPPDMMYPRLINPEFTPKNTIEKLFNDTVESNFNMIRLWGGGQYESDQFFQLASKKGIMIFHDFMFSDSIYPGTDTFLNNVKEEIVYQVRRIRNYPAVVLWSGNNQIFQGIQSWGWGQPKYRQNYKKLFGGLIPEILKQESVNIPYIESSPSKGVGNGGFSMGGDIHYWGVWAAGSPFQAYETALGGFNSEFGTQSLPVWQTILQFTHPPDRVYESDKMAFHEKHLSRFRTLQSYIKRYSRQSINFELQTYSSGLVHAYAMEIAIRAQRISKPKSWGTLYWMLNDAWPSISWSSIDYYGRWKAVQYYAKKLYKDVILFYHPHSNRFVVVNDKLVPIKANYYIEVMTFGGQKLFNDSGTLSLNPNERRDILHLEGRVFAGKERQAFVYTQIVYGIRPENRSILTTFFKAFKDLELDPAQLRVHYLYGSDQIIFSSNYLIKNLYISNRKFHMRYSDNYFDVVPGKESLITVINPPADLKELKNNFVFRSYRQIYDPEPLSVKVEN